MSVESSSPGQLYVGTGSTSIIPDGSVMLAGQLYVRISQGAETPLLASALVIETRADDRVVDHAVLISCDLVVIGDLLTGAVRELVAQRLPEIDPDKVIINATHTHTAPQVREVATLPEGVDMGPAEFRSWLAVRLVDLIASAWQGRRPVTVGWGLGHAVVGANRRAVYADGRSVMYGKVDSDDFRGIEGYEDHGMEVLCFWGEDDQLIATAVNIACPAQEVEHEVTINADFWHEVRQTLQAEFGPDLCVLGWVAAAGDQSPHLMLRKESEERMRRLRGISRLQELAQRVVAGWREAYDGARQERHATVSFSHRVWRTELPQRLVTVEERDAAIATIAEMQGDPDKLPRIRWQQRVIDRYDGQQDPAQPEQRSYPTELHALRLGDIAIVTNQFELFTDFGVQLIGRSPALQTFVIQLAVGEGTYLPSERAVAGGGYSAIIQSNRVGPAGGQQLVEETLTELHRLWPTSSRSG